MADNGTGTFIRLYNFITDKINAIPITASRMDGEFDGIATGLSNRICKDGQTVITANIPMASHKFTGLAVGSARTDSITVGQVQDGQFTALGTTGGAADAYTASPSPAITAYTATMQYSAKIHATNLTTTPTFGISALTAGTIKKWNAAGAEIAVEASDMLIGKIYHFHRNPANDGWIVENPEKPYININNATYILDSNAVNNLGLASSVATNALTIALKTKAGTDPTATDAVKISFRDATLTTGTYNTRTATAATSLVISSGSTLGTGSGLAASIYVYALDNAGTVELAASLTLFEDNSIQSTTAEGGGGGADSSTVLYSTTARTNVPVRLVGRLTITEATAGTWATEETVITLLPPAVATAPMVLISSATASASTAIEFTSGINSTYSKYIIELSNVIPATDAPLQAFLSTDGGATYITTNYKGFATYNSNAELTLNVITTSTSRIDLHYNAGGQGVDSASTNGLSGEIVLYNPSNTATYKQIYCKTLWTVNSGYAAGGEAYQQHTGSTSAVNAIKIAFPSVNITSGTFKLYGVL